MGTYIDLNSILGFKIGFLSTAMKTDSRLLKLSEHVGNNYHIVDRDYVDIMYREPVWRNRYLT